MQLLLDQGQAGEADLPEGASAQLEAGGAQRHLHAPALWLCRLPALPTSQLSFCGQGAAGLCRLVLRPQSPRDSAHSLGSGGTEAGVQ